MNKKEYELIADVVRLARSIEDEQRYWLAAEFADTLESVYDNFDREMFMIAVADK